MHQLMGFLNTGFTGAFGPLWAALEAADAEPDIGSVAPDSAGRPSPSGRKLEALIGDRPYLVGNRPRLADGLLIGVARWPEYHEAPDLAPGRDWRRSAAVIEADPAVQFAVAIEDGETPAGSGAMQGHIPLYEVIARFTMRQAA